MTMTIIYRNVNINAYGNDCKYIKVKVTYSFTDDTEEKSCTFSYRYISGDRATIRVDKAGDLQREREKGAAIYRKEARSLGPYLYRECPLVPLRSAPSGFIL
jgi:hypothetical protein